MRKRIAIRLLYMGVSLGALSAPLSAKTCDIRTYGAKGDGTTLNTQVIQEAIDDCAGAGGGTVLVDGGTYVTGTLTLKSGITLEITKGSVLQGTRTTSAYPAMRAKRKCERCNENLSLLWAEGAKNITITGGGTLDGNDGGRGNPWGPGGTGGRPRLVRFFEVDSLVIRNISFIRSASWTTWLSGCTNVTIDSLTVNSRTGQGNQDGLDIDDCKNMTVRNSSFTTGDDAICFKSMQYGDRIENVLIENIVVHMVTHAAVKMGTESHGGMRNVMIRNVRVVQSNSGALGLYSVRLGKRMRT
jgi:polygalacturonase